MDTEAAHRSAVSRAYYASLHSVAESFDERQRLSAESSHGAIIGRVEAYYNQIPPQPGRSAAIDIHRAVSRLRRERNKADYNLDQTMNSGNSNDAITRSQHVLKLCSEVQAKRSAEPT